MQAPAAIGMEAIQKPVLEIVTLYVVNQGAGAVVDCADLGDGSDHTSLGVGQFVTAGLHPQFGWLVVLVIEPPIRADSCPLKML